MDQRGEGLRPWQSWVLPLAGGLVAATIAATLSLPSPAHPLTWTRLVSRSAFLLVLSAGTATAGASLLRRVFDGCFEALRSDLLCCAGGAAIWLPLCLLLQSEHAVWCILAPVPATAIIVAFSRWQLSPRKSALVANDVVAWEQRTRPSELFASVAALRRMPIATTALISAALVEASIGAAAAQAYSFAESLVLIATACIVWHTTPEPDPRMRHQNAGRRRAGVLVCFLLTCLSMTPFLQAGNSTLPLGSLVLAGARSVAPHPPTKQMAARVYTGVVLLAPPLPKRKLIEPPPKSVLAGMPALREPMIIPFDGSYWFYQQPDSAPGKDAPVQRGDPVKNHIQSTNFYPLRMEAHQRLGTHVGTDCCGAISVSLTNADNRLGLIEVEAVLREITPEGTRTHSLGVRPIRSSEAEKISIYRTPTQETLRFPMRAAQPNFRFNEITLIFHLSRHRNLANAEVKIKDFTLSP